RILAEWEAAPQAAGEEAIAHLRRLLPLCEPARQALVAHEAARVLEESSAALPPGLRPLPDVSAALAARHELGQFGAAFRELEREYARASAEEELLGARKIPGEPLVEG